jgi:hypothetical protein
MEPVLRLCRSSEQRQAGANHRRHGKLIHFKLRNAIRTPGTDNDTDTDAWARSPLPRSKTTV